MNVAQVTSPDLIANVTIFVFVYNELVQLQIAQPPVTVVA